MISFIPLGVCSKQISFEVENNNITLLLSNDRNCSNKGTSCPDQLARALEKTNSANT